MIDGLCCTELRDEDISRRPMSVSSTFLCVDAVLTEALLCQQQTVLVSISHVVPSKFPIRVSELCLMGFVCVNHFSPKLAMLSNLIKKPTSKVRSRLSVSKPHALNQRFSNFCTHQTPLESYQYSDAGFHSAECVSFGRSRVQLQQDFR